MTDGIITGFQHPFGSGLGATTQAAIKFTGANSGTEFDVSNVFVSGGAPSGLVYVAFLAGALSVSAQLYRRQRTVAPLAVFLATIGSIGQILGSGNYVIGPTVLALLGWCAAEWARVQRQSEGLPHVSDSHGSVQPHEL
jgi:hypothetical protein